jgi:hypothetical protein
MVGTLENPTLDLNPALPETLDVITATRAGIATYTDPNGNIATASADTVRVDYTQGAELTPTKFQRFVNTEFDQAYWSFSSQMGNPVYNYDTAPNGEQEATRIVSNGGSYPQIVETITGLTVGQEYTASFYVKSDGTSQIQQATHFTGLSGGIGFTPTDNWERASYTITATATTHNFVIFTNSGSAPASSYLIWGPQVEEGTTASSFVENTTGSPKFITGATYGPRVPMILVEPSATNLVESSDINSDWGFYSNDSTITQHTSDLGEINAYVLSRIGSNQKTSLQHGDISGGSTTNATASLFYKNIGEARFFQFWDTNLSGNNFVNVDTISDAFNASAGSAKITNLGNGWRRLEWTRPDSASQSSGKIRLSLADSLGDSRNSNFAGTGGIAFAGVQLEEGDVATSFIPTSGSTVTRAADNLVISGSDFSGFFNASEGTVYTEFVPTQASAGRYVWSINNGTYSSRTFQNILSNLQLTNTYRINNSDSFLQTITTHNVSPNEINRTAFTYSSDLFQSSIDGNNSSSNSGATTSAFNKLNLGATAVSSDINTYALTGHVKRLIYWPYSSDRL